MADTIQLPEEWGGGGKTEETSLRLFHERKTLERMPQEGRLASRNTAHPLPSLTQRTGPRMPCRNVSGMYPEKFKHIIRRGQFFKSHAPFLNKTEPKGTCSTASASQLPVSRTVLLLRCGVDASNFLARLVLFVLQRL